MIVYNYLSEFKRIWTGDCERLLMRFTLSHKNWVI
jgi:hypothetical protein